MQMNTYNVQGESLKQKAGVSLIAVLLFMLIATIAATATWKWITSEGFSSTSRMLKREAYQSSMAGIENARAWMTFHANDVGALIKQYLDDPDRKAINLDGQLRDWQRANQKYHVWLTGVNVENSVYKLKIFSAGESRNNARHNEVAIFNVEGLYRISVPQEHVHRVSDFDYNYFGGSTINHGDIFARSMLVNGDLLDGNPASIDSNLVVTGNFKVSGNSIAVHGTACIGGNLDADNGLVGNNFYVDGDLKNLKIRALTAKRGSETVNLGNSIYGNLYVKGNITAANGNQVIDGNLTLKGKWTTNMSGYNAGVNGDLCVDSVGQIYFPNLDREFKAKGNVWMSTDLPIWVDAGMSWFGFGPTDVDNYSKYKRISLGTKDKNVYVKTGHPSSDYKTLRNNTFKFNEINNKPFLCSDGAGSVPDCDKEDLKWKNKNDVKVFIDRAEKPDLYYLYNWNSTTPVVSYAEDNYTETHWAGNPATLTVYKVNGEPFWRTWGVWNGIWGTGTASFVSTLNYANGRPTGTPYCYQGTGVGPEQYRQKARPTCGVAPWFRVEGNFKTPFPGSQPADLTCAASVKAHCDSLWDPTDGCGSANYLVPDPLRTGISFFENYANNTVCVKDYVENVTDKTNFNFSQFNTCYSGASTANKLYNGYLVVKITSAANDIFVSSKGVLTGKYVFIFEGDMNENIKLPATAAGSYAFLYFKDGWSGEILPMDNAGDNEFNYFIYTKNDIKNILFNQTVLKGSVYAAVKDEETGTKTCAKVNNLTFNKGMEFNQELISDLTEAGVICKNDGSSCGGINGETSTTEETEETTEDSEGGKDRFYISMAPQLNISVESMYEAEERKPAANAVQTLDPSYIILPRVIYLPADPYGELKDYYNVVPLNGSSLTKSNIVNSISCSGGGSLRVTGKLFTGTRLSQGVYKCAAEPSGYNRVPFWVVVGNTLRGDGEVSFEVPAQTMGATTTKEVNILVSPHSTELDVTVNCPDAPDSWLITLNDLYEHEKTGNTCVFKIPVNTQNGVYKLFDVSTTGATSGKVIFTLQPGTGYTLSSPYYTELGVASTARISRSEATSAEISQYCTDHPGVCPSDRSRWPNCAYTGLWVEPQGGTSAIVPDELNNMWSVSIGGEGSFSLVDRSGGGKCVVIIPETDNEILKSSMESDHTYPLRASAKALTRTLKIAFMGDIDGTPTVNYSTESGSGVCSYNGLGYEHACSVPVFDGETIGLSINTENSDNSTFSYWKCSGSSCPANSGAVLNSGSTFDSFVLNDNETVVYVHFGETDKHCFIEEFKDNNVRCTADRTEYCIDKCDDSDNALCVGAVDANGTFTNAKWHLLSGSLDNIEAYAGHVSIVNKRKVTRGVNNKNSAIKVISTVNAGFTGTLKALFRMPQETSSYDRFADNISKSGFMLRSDVTGMEYLMLNVYVNKSGRLEAQVCTEGARCLNAELEQNGVSMSASTATMVMLSATLNAENKLVISAFAGSYNYYGDVSDHIYSHTFTLTDLPSTYADRAHEYVGFSLADPNFKIYGIGWESFDYRSQCWDTPPSVKCSFAAKAQNGIIELGEKVYPWVGHSGWFNSLDCTPQYFYYNGNDANCGTAGPTGVGCTDGYTFEESGKGQHGYGADQKTAKVALECRTSDSEQATWLQSAGRAHCGIFWTGEFESCKQHFKDLVVDKVLPAGSENLEEEQIVDASRNRRNLRNATLVVVLDNPDSNEVEIALVSKHDFDNATVDTSWGDRGQGNDIYISQSVKMRGNAASFDVSDMANGAEGFDPQNVRSIILRNHGETSVTVKSISTNCKSVVGVTSCKAVYNDSAAKWFVTANILNYGSVSTIKTTMKIDGQVGSTTIGCDDQDAECTRDAGSGIVNFAIADNPYVHRGEHYKFSVEAQNAAKVGGSANCSVSPDPIGEVSRDCRVNPTSVQQEAGMPQFQFEVYGCPSAGCPYSIYLDGGSTPISTGSAQSGVPIKYTAPGNGVGSAAEIKEHTYKVSSTDNKSPFDDCTATFAVTEKKNANDAVRTECWFEGTSYKPGEYRTMKFTVNNGSTINITGRNYRLVLPDNNVITGSTGTGTEQSVGFNVPNAGGTTTLEVWDKNAYKTACEINMEVLSVEPKNCDIVDNNNNNYRFVAHFDNTCQNNACQWTLKKTYAGSVTNVIEGNVTQNDISVNLSDLGVYTLWVNGTEYESCSAVLGPKVTCPTKSTFSVDETTASLYMAALSNCGAGCDYDLTLSGESTPVARETSGAYRSASNAINFTSMASPASNVGYQFKVYSHSDENLQDACNGTMDFIAGSVCQSVTWTMSGGNSNSQRPSPDYPWTSGCVDITSNRICFGGVTIKAPSCTGHYGKWNGVDFQLTGSEGYKRFDSNPVPSTNSNLTINDCEGISELYMDGCETVSTATEVPAISNCPQDMVLKADGASITINPTISNCKVIGGCTYTLSNGASTFSGTYYQGSISFTGEMTENEYSYTLTARNNAGAGSTSCPFKITYENNAVPDWTGTLTEGTHHVYKCKGLSGTLNVSVGVTGDEECLDLFPSASGGSYGDGNPPSVYYCNANFSLEFPTTITVPAGVSISVQNCSQ